MHEGNKILSAIVQAVRRKGRQLLGTSSLSIVRVQQPSRKKAGAEPALI
jgi:hypothetical protein